jgi:gluconolactonase
LGLKPTFSGSADLIAGRTSAKLRSMMTILRDAGLSQIVASSELTLLARGFVFTEGPLWCRDGSLLFQDIKADRTFRLAKDGAVQLLREHTRTANGQTFGPGGTVVFCEQTGRRISRMDPDGKNVTALAETWSGGRLNSPNDIVCRSDGLAYFTDPPYGVEPGERSLHFQGVYALDLEPGRNKSLRLLADDFEKPNGLAFSPDERTLYVCDTARYHVRAFDVEPSGGLKVGSSRVFCRLDPGKPGGPDGLKVDRAGRVYVAVALGVWVFEPDGRLLGILSVPARPANLAWCGPKADHLAITAVDAVYDVQLQVEGILPPFTP